ncbi:MAG TPA: hypothetical protein VFP84_22370, partial [Kofleriaceae bacterium]|nr:hypothetical protein [Kofleriaceae bacterium]
MKRGLRLAVWIAPSAILVVATSIVFHAFRIPPPARLGSAERDQVIAVLRRSPVDAAPPPAGPAPTPPTTLVVTMWSAGRTAGRAEGHGAGLTAAALDARAALYQLPKIAALSPDDLRAARLQVDVIAGTAPLGAGHWLFDTLAIPGLSDMLAINPGLEGIGAEVDGKHAYLLPHELVAGRLLTAKRPSEALPDFAMGVDLKRIAQLLAGRGSLGRTPRPDELFRFRTDS